MVTHTKKFGFLTDIEMVPQILLVRGFIQTVDQILKQLTGAVRCNLVADLNASFAKKLSTMIWSMEYEGKSIHL